MIALGREPGLEDLAEKGRELHQFAAEALSDLPEHYRQRDSRNTEENPKDCAA